MSINNVIHTPQLSALRRGPATIEPARKEWILLSAIAFTFVIFLTTGCSSSKDVGTATDASATPSVKRVIDGDTVVIRINGVDERVRLIGVDTPETKDPRKPVQCFGEEASAFTKSLLPEGTPLRLERDVEERDRFGRLLAYVYRLDDDLFVNRELVARGYAMPLTIAPNVTHADEFVALAAAARDAGLGLWGACGGSDVPTS